MSGCTAWAVMVSLAMSLLTEPPLLLTSTEYAKSAPMSALLVAGVVYVLLVAPLMSVPFFFHW